MEVTSLNLNGALIFFFHFFIEQLFLLLWKMSSFQNVLTFSIDHQANIFAVQMIKCTMKPSSDIHVVSHLNLYKRWCSYSLDYKLSNAISLIDLVISLGQVEKNNANISTVIPVNNSCPYINMMFPRETGSKKCVGGHVKTHS